MTETASYVGNELEVFSQAARWKHYWSEQIAAYLRGDVLEVGAGIGSNTRVLRGAGQGRWVCLEPDRALAARMTEAIRSGLIEPPCEVLKATVADLEARLGKLRLVAPADATVGVLVAKPGEIVPVGKPVLTLYVGTERWFAFTLR